MSILNIPTARAFIPLLQPSRYKGAYGGRGAAKSHFFAELIVERCYASLTRAVCIREVQNTIKESVKQLLTDKIAKLGLGHFFTITESEIRGINGSLIIFRGMQHYNADSIKSLEGFDIAWVEEAQSLSQRSLDLLRPTIRKPGSELWFSWNPENEDDPVDVFFRQQGRENTICQRVNWNDNPWFPDVLREEMESDYKTDPEKAAHIWGGEYSIITEASYYGMLLAMADKEGRIGEFGWDKEYPVETAWDIGVDDYTAIWFFQRQGLKVRAIDYFECSGEGAQQISTEAIHAKPYQYKMHYLPHDVTNREWGAGAKTRVITLRELGVRPIHAGGRQGPAERINASRALLPMVSFNKATCQLGIKRLRNYVRQMNKTMGTYSGPRHDENSHGADAFGEYALNCPITAVKQQRKSDKKPDDYRQVQKATRDDSWRL